MIKNGIIFCLLICVLSGLSFNKIKFNKTIQNKICIRIVNNSQYKFTNISLFSLSFKEINVGNKSQYKVLNFDKNKDDGMLYLTVNKVRFAIYITPESQEGKYTYIIDSTNLKTRFLNYRLIKN